MSGLTISYHGYDDIMRLTLEFKVLFRICLIKSF